MARRADTTNACPEACQAICCRYVTTKIDAPRTKLDFDELYWFLCHEKVEVFIEGRKWYLLFDSRCKNLDGRSRCRLYPKRPYVCRQHSVEECEYRGEEDRKEYMRSPEDLKKHMKRRGIRLRMAWNEPGEQLRGPARSRSRSGSRKTRRPKRGQ